MCHQSQAWQLVLAAGPAPVPALLQTAAPPLGSCVLSGPDEEAQTAIVGVFWKSQRLSSGLLGRRIVAPGPESPRMTIALARILTKALRLGTRRMPLLPPLFSVFNQEGLKLKQLEESEA